MPGDKTIVSDEKLNIDDLISTTTTTTTTTLSTASTESTTVEIVP